MPCRHCHRADCPLLADVIVGTRNFFAALRDCYRAEYARKKG